MLININKDVQRMTKKCIKCDIEKELEEYPQYKKRNGEKAYRNVCRNCMNKQDRSSRTTGTGTRVYTKSDNDLTTHILSFTDAEVTELKQFVKERMQLKTETTPSKRIVKTFNVDECLYELVAKTAKESNMSISDTLNKILQSVFNKSY
jgi:DNA-binding transcriptional MerR regulator